MTEDLFTAGLVYNDGPKKKSTAEQAEARRYKTALATRRDSNMRALASMDPADAAELDSVETRTETDGRDVTPGQAFEDQLDRRLVQGHPGRNAEGATTPDDHNIAKGYHERRASALGADSAAAKAHLDAAKLHETAGASGSEGDSKAARLMSAQANRLEWAETGDLGQ